MYLTLIANKYTLYTLFLTLGENFRRGKVTKFFTSDEYFPRRKISPTKIFPDKIFPDKVEHIPKEVNKFINNDTTKSSAIARIKSNIFRIQAYDSVMWRYFCIEFINYMLKGKTLLDYTNLFSPNDFKKNDQVIKRIFRNA